MHFYGNMYNFKFNYLSRGQLVSLNLDKTFLTLLKILPCYEAFFGNLILPLLLECCAEIVLIVCKPSKVLIQRHKLENLGVMNNHLYKFEKLMQKCHGMKYSATVQFCNEFVSKSKKSKIITANSNGLLNRLSCQPAACQVA